MLLIHKKERTLTRSTEGAPNVSEKLDLSTVTQLKKRRSTRRLEFRRHQPVIPEGDVPITCTIIGTPCAVDDTEVSYLSYTLEEENARSTRPRPPGREMTN